MGMTEPREMPAETSVPDDVLRSCDQLAEQLQLPRVEVSLEERLRQVLEAVVRLRAERDAAYRSLSSLHAQLVEFDRALADAKRELEKVWSSKTWRYTAPFRKLYSRCRKVLGRLL